MASLNWVMLSPETHTPVPLPSEKMLSTISQVTLSLFPSLPGAGPNAKPTPPSSELKADKGVLYASNKRVVYVAGTGKGVKEEGKKVESLSIPWASFVDGRFVQPWFGATYYEALALPDPRSTESGISTPHLCRFYFNESGGYQFYEVAEEMKARLSNGLTGRSGRGTPIEALPLYEPQSSTTMSSTVPEPSTILSELDPSPLLNTATSFVPSSNSITSEQPRQQEPSTTDMEVAHIAQTADLTEADQAERDLDRRSMDLLRTASNGSGNGENEDGPPGYEI